MEPRLIPRTSTGALVEQLSGDLTRLQIPAGPAGRYRLAQLDDAGRLPRRSYPWRPPLTFSLEARAQAGNYSGTWGFGLWNAPLSVSIGFGSSAALPALPDAAWFFHASPRCHLSFRDDRPARGFLAQTFRSHPIPIWALAPAAVLLPFVALRKTGRLIRRAVSRRLISEDGAALDPLDPADWHHYRIDWTAGGAALFVDDNPVLQTPISPRPPLSIVIWVDNQFAAWTPAGDLAYGLEEHDLPASLEIRGLQCRSP